ncbi:hypothetical protein [Glycomyces paridis]|uniref:Uncharacterized protein n=1 Tax=Glycomyces paridis TaxID=2126555 RepID=A0A4S8NZ58_9ACTN|nr:hypothetical protein [Glycomyces paridis]THV22878.1 hypothetical protein E9998_23645 [Glycomyces paridis]
MALPFAALVATVMASAGTDWLLGAVIGVVVWQWLYAIGVGDQYQGLRAVLLAASRGTLPLEQTAAFGRRTFGPPPEGYDPYSHGMPTGAAPLERTR